MQLSLSQMPASLEQLYTRSLNRVEIEHPRGPSGRSIPLQILQWLSFSDNPLALEDLAAALAHLGLIEENSQETHRGLLTGLDDFISLDFTDNTVRLIHLSAKEFLISRDVLEDGISRAIEEHLPQGKQRIEELPGNAPLEEVPGIPEQIDGENDDEDSDTASIWSATGFSETSSRSSQSSSFLQLMPVIDQYARLFANEERLRPLIGDSLDTFGVAGFERLFVQGLQRYSMELLKLAGTVAQKTAAIIVGDDSRAIAERTVSRTGFLDVSRPLGPIIADAEDRAGAALLNERVQRLDKIPLKRMDDTVFGGTAVKLDSNLLTSAETQAGFSRPTTSEDKARAEEALHLQVDPVQAPLSEKPLEETYTNLELVKRFLTSGNPFNNLISTLVECLDPTMSVARTSLFRLTEPDPEAPKYSLSSRRLTWWGSCLGFVRKNITTAEPPLEKGMRRVRWTCVSTNHAYPRKISNGF